MWNIGIMARFTESAVNRHCSAMPIDALEEVVVREHHTLRQTGRARRVELERDIVTARLHARIVGRLGIDPVLVVDGQRSCAADGDDRANAGELGLDLLDVRHELRADDDDLGLRVVDDLRHLGRCQPPVDRHVDRAELGQRRR